MNQRNPQNSPRNTNDRDQQDWTPADTDHLRQNSGYQLHGWGQSRGRNSAPNRNEGYMEDVWNRSNYQPSSQGYGGYQRVEGYNPYDRDLERNRNPDYDYASSREERSAQQPYAAAPYSRNRPSQPTRDWGRSSTHSDSARYSQSQADYNRNQTIGAYNEYRSGYDDSRRHLEPNQPMQSFRGKGPKGYVRADQRIQEDICDRLSEDPYIDASEVTVTCADGVVTLQGSVDSRQTKHRIEDLVDSCSGVKDIHNQLKVGSGIGETISNAVESVKDTFTPNERQPH